MNYNFTDIKAPELPESVIDATIIKWHKKEGDYVKCNDVLVDIETDKIILEVPSPSEGTIEFIIKNKGSKIKSKEILGKISDNKTILKKEIKTLDKTNTTQKKIVINSNFTKKKFLTPSLRRLLKINNLKSSDVNNTTEKNKITNKNINNLQEKILHKDNDRTIPNLVDSIKKEEILERTQNRTPMTHIRKKISERLLESQKNMAMLTTFNEVNMESIIKLREKYNKKFEKCHNVKLGFMPFFVKAVIDGLKKFPEINASIDNQDIVRYNYIDISIAIATHRGLITPVLKNADKMNIPQIEKKIKELVIKGNTGKLTIEELIGGNVTISNSGVFGSLMSTPIINPPQSTILGIHSIKNRPMVVNNQITILPMMYLALSYDHRLIDGKEAVSFLIRIKDVLEDFSRIALDV